MAMTISGTLGIMNEFAKQTNHRLKRRKHAVYSVRIELLYSILVCVLLTATEISSEPSWMLLGVESTSLQPTRGVLRGSHSPTRGSYLQTYGRNTYKQSRAISSDMSNSRALQIEKANEQPETSAEDSKRSRRKSRRKTQAWCFSLPGLVSRQRRMCLENPDLVAAAMRGTSMAVRECERQFNYDRWNCSLILTNMSGGKPRSGEKTEDARGEVLSPGLRNATREGAFLHAIMSAGIAHAVTVACRAGELTGCHCDKSVSKLNIAMAILGEKFANGGQTKKASKAALDAIRSRRLFGGTGFVKNGTIRTWTSLRTPASSGISWGEEVEQISWGGCSDDVKFGVRFSRRFVEAPYKDVPSRERTARDCVNLHNGEVGRRMVQALTKVHCRCHGMSGSCTAQTCWMQMANFEDVGDALKRKYLSGIHAMKEGKKRRKLRHMTVHSYDIDSGRLRRVPKTELTFINETPNLCLKDEELGIAGTIGRQCLKHSGDSGDCRFLCCGRGYNTRQVRIRSRCKCKFVWCCDVQCQVCEEVRNEYTCKA